MGSVSFEGGSKPKTRRISVVVPLFNEGRGVAYLSANLKQLQKAMHEDDEPEFIFVDDGSTDDTKDRLSVLFGNEPNCRILVHEQNRGIGAAFRTGFQHSTGAIVCTVDADCSYTPQRLTDLLSALERTKADIALASPYHPRGGVEGVPRWRLLLSRTCSHLYQLISPLRLYTYTSVFRVYRREVIENVGFRSDGFVSAVEILILAARQGYQITEVPMVLRARQIGHSKMKIARTVRRHLSFMAAIATSRPDYRARRVSSRHSEILPTSREVSHVVTSVRSSEWE